ncbi:uncharacterized protein LOC118437688 [Folsomia candida]|uniref:Uncharacterized protein n=1 Tax=Folsomia candida TaxID=158441 RepID=A0A226DMK9_FOLCA|nr:uncharacterized protein LOC118437688 [Folsomia candida]OXA46419.1 hypothetical protein Fcan01_18706 [Folsomia candida]
MLTPTGVSAVCHLLDVGSGLKLFPFDFDPKEKCVKRAGRGHRFYFDLHKTAIYVMTLFSAVRLIQAMSRDHFPLVLRILNMVWLAAYTLGAICYAQFARKEGEMIEFVNCLLGYMRRTSINKNPHNFKSEKSDKNGTSGMSENWPVSTMSSYTLAESKSQKYLTYYVYLGLIMLAANPTIHILLVDESPCAPHFVSSLFLPCEGFRDYYIPFLHKIPFMAIEYYLTTVFFFSWSFNWAVIFLGMSWIVAELRRMSYNLSQGLETTVQQYRSIECIAILMNDAFFMYLSTFPNLLFAIVSILMFGVIRIWHYDPGSNLMFPLCGIRCAFEAVTPLAVAGDVNDKNKEVVAKWKLGVVARSAAKKEAIAYQKSFHAVRCTAGSLYTFENSIVLCCLNNCMQLTLNLFLTFK